SRDGRWMASAGEDGKVFLWDVANGMNRRELRTEVSGVTGVNPRFEAVPSGFGLALSPDGQWIAAGSMGALWLWKADSGEPLRPVKHDGLVRSIGFSQDGRYIATADRTSGLVAGFERVTDGWNPVPDAVPIDPPYKANGVSFLSSSIVVVAGSFGSPHQHGVWLWDLLHSREAAFVGASEGVGDFGECRAPAVSLDAQTLAALCVRGILVATGDRLAFHSSGQSREDPGGFSVSYGLSLNGNGRSVAAADNGRPGHGFGDRQKGEVATIAGPALAVAFHPDGKRIATGLEDGRVAFWPTTRGVESIRVPNGGAVSAAAFTPDERWLVLTGGDGVISVVDLSDPRNARQIHSWRVDADLGRAVVSPDGRFMAVPGGAAVHVIDARTWKLFERSLTGAASAAAFSLDGRLLLTMGESGIRRFDTATWKELPSFAGNYKSVGLSPDGRFLGATHQTLKSRRQPITLRQVWSVTTGDEVAWRETGRQPSDGAPPRPTQGGSQALVSDSDKWKAIDDESRSSNGEWAFDLNRFDSTLELKQAASGRVLARLEHDDAVVDAVFSPRGRWL